MTNADSRLNCCVNARHSHLNFLLLTTTTMYDDTEVKVGFKRAVAKVAKKDSDVNGMTSFTPPWYHL